MAEDTLTHDQALMMPNDHLDEDVFVGLTMSTADGDFSVMRMVGTLGKMVVEETTSRDATLDAKNAVDPMYTVGGEACMLPPLPGSVLPTDLGLEWRLAEGLTLRINWTQERLTAAEGGA